MRRFRGILVILLFLLDRVLLGCAKRLLHEGRLEINKLKRPRKMRGVVLDDSGQEDTRR